MGWSWGYGGGISKPNGAEEIGMGFRHGLGGDGVTR